MSDTTAQTTPAAGAFRILIDGECALCSREARFMQKLDAGRGRLEIVDITAPDFEPATIGRTHDDVMRQIHGITPEGEVLVGVEVFRRAYAAVGKGWLLAWTSWPVIRPLVDLAYRFFARHRQRFSRAFGCIGGACGVPVDRRGAAVSADARS